MPNESPELEVESAEPEVPLANALADFIKTESPETAESLLSDKPALERNTPLHRAPAPQAKEEPAKSEPDPKVEPDPATEPDAAKVAEAQQKAEAAEAKRIEAEAKAAQQAKHADLDKIAGMDDPHIRPSTRKKMEAVKQETIKAREAAEAAQAQLNKALEEAAELKKKVSESPASEALQKELQEMRERVRELDITKDPEIKSKYDDKIAANTDAVFKILIGQGIDKTRGEDGKMVENLAALNALKKSGISFSTVQPYIDALKKAGLHDEAEGISDAIRENARLARDKDSEIKTWTANYETRQAERSKAGQQQSDGYLANVTKEAQTAAQKNIEDLAKQFPYVKQPAAPLASEPAAVQKSKQTALDEYNAAQKLVGEAVKQFDTRGLPADKAAVAQGRLHASAIDGIMIRQHVIPRVVKQLAALEARNKELEGEVTKFRKGGAMSRAHSAEITSGRNGGVVPDSSVGLADALRQVAKGGGLAV